MGSIPSELSLDVRPTYVPKTISDFLGELTAIDSVSDRLFRLDDFVQRLDDEMRKIDAFKRELPLCMLLLNDAIATLKEESKQCRPRNVEPVLEEFIPLKKNCDENEKSEAKKEKDSGGDKMNWMSSVQLWNTDNLKNIDSKTDQKQNSVPKLREGVGEEFRLVIDDPSQSGKNKVGLRAFMPFKTCPVFPARKEDKELSVAGLSLLTPGIKNSREDVGSNGLSSKNNGSTSSTSLNGHSNLRAGLLSQQQTARKQRRCWSPELHRRFINALQQLGGSQVANSVAEACTIYVSNKCPFPIWPATAPNKGQPVIANGGFYLPPGQTKTIQAPGTWSGRIWARTGCNFNSNSKSNWKPACETGDCNQQFECKGEIGLPPVTLVEFSLQVDKKKPSFYDVSLVDGYNLPVSVSTKRLETKCSIGGCLKNLKSVCPEELQVLNDRREVVACKSACLAFDLDKFCCRNEFRSPQKCKPSVYSKIFKDACPNYFSYAFDSPSPLVNCPSDEYVVTFCPSKWGTEHTDA